MLRRITPECMFTFPGVSHPGRSTAETRIETLVDVDSQAYAGLAARTANVRTSCAIFEANRTVLVHSCCRLPEPRTAQLLAVVHRLASPRCPQLSLRYLISRTRHRGIIGMAAPDRSRLFRSRSPTPNGRTMPRCGKLRRAALPWLGGISLFCRIALRCRCLRARSCSLLIW